MCIYVYVYNRVKTELSLHDWLDGTQKTVRSSIQQDTTEEANAGMDWKGEGEEEHATVSLAAIVTCSRIVLIEGKIHKYILDLVWISLWSACGKYSAFVQKI